MPSLTAVPLRRITEAVRASAALFGGLAALAGVLAGLLLITLWNGGSAAGTESGGPPSASERSFAGTASPSTNGSAVSRKRLRDSRRTQPESGRLAGSARIKETTDRSAASPQGGLTTAINSCVAGGESRSYCECSITEITRGISSTAWNEVIRVTRAGAKAYADLPAQLRDDVLDANMAAAERRCS